RAAACAAAVAKTGAKTPTPIGDIRTILDDKTVDALVIAAPNHWHAPATIMAVNAGKHAYCEKPCSHNPQEGEWMVQAAHKNNRAVQIGTQRRSGPQTIQAIQKLHDGVIGRVYLARAYYNSARGSLGHGKPAAIPKHLNYELWQGPAPRTPYFDNRVHYNWHWFWHWGNGELGNNGIHTLDLCRWGLGVDFPIRVNSSGGRYHWTDDQQTPDTHQVSFEFPGNRSVTWQGLSCNRHRGSFVTFYGDKGSLELDSDGGHVVYNGADKIVEKVSGKSRGDIEHIDNFTAAIRNDAPQSLNCEVTEGHKSTLLCHLGNIAQRTGQSITCRSADGHIVGNDQAAKLWERDYQDGWKPVV
ncbi:MAG: Gfo/Idh/MocA family oxidoreductase, partial [Planctomycetaceae bacterium]